MPVALLGLPILSGKKKKVGKEFIHSQLNPLTVLMGHFYHQQLKISLVIFAMIEVQNMFVLIS